MVKKLWFLLQRAPLPGLGLEICLCYDTLYTSVCNSLPHF